MINQVLGSPIGGGIGRILLRLGGAEPRIVEVAGPGARWSSARARIALSGKARRAGTPP